MASEDQVLKWLAEQKAQLSEEIKAMDEKLYQQQKEENDAKINESQTQILLAMATAKAEIIAEVMMKAEAAQAVFEKQVTVQIGAMNTKLKEQKGKGEDGQEKDKKEKRTMTTRNNFRYLPKYNGKHEEFDDWKFKMRTFLSEESELKELLLKLEELTEVPDDEYILNLIKEIHASDGQGEDEKWMNHQLYQVLCLNLEGKAVATVKNLTSKKDVNGVLGWCKLMQDCSSMTAQRLQGLAVKVYSPKRCKLYADVNSSIEEWEANVAMFTAVEGKDMNPATKLYAIRQIVPEELEKDIVRASTSLNTYELVRSYIFEQVAVRRDVKNASK